MTEDLARVAHPDFWEAAYREERTGWDLGAPAPPFLDLLLSPAAPTPGRLLVPGCGRGHDAQLFARFGFTVSGIDFAPSAIQAAKEAARQAGVTLELQQADLFTLAERWPAHFDYVAEHTCFCAIDPARRSDYVRVIHDVLRPGGELIALFFAHGRPGGPPFTTSAEEIQRLFEPLFIIESLEPAANSAPRRRGEELLARLRRAD